MELPTLLVCIALAAFSDQQLVNGADSGRDLWTDLGQITPATVFVGKSNGDILACPFDAPDDCKVYYRLGDYVKFISVYGEFLYASLDNTRKIMRCELHKANSCVDFYKFDSDVCSMSIERGGHIFAGLRNGNVMRCSLQPHSCSAIYVLPEAVYSVLQFNESLYAAAGTELFRCSGSNMVNCSIVDDFAEITELTVSNNTLFALTSTNELCKCDDEPGTRFCKLAKLPGLYPPRTMTSFNGKIYIAYHNTSQPIMSCKWGTVPECSEYLRQDDAKVVAFTYAMHLLQNRFRDEQKSCTWQGSRCPPFVTYYEANDRTGFEVRVKNGKLYDSRGAPVDTADADMGKTGPAAIFVMAPEGRLLLSKTHARALLHTSSLLSGQPVSGAGEIVVKDGVIEHINTCSQHYLPNLSLNAQVIKSLLYQGYMKPIELKPCPQEN